MDKSILQKASFLLVVSVLITLGYIFSIGFYNIYELILLTCAFLLAACFPILNFKRPLFAIDFAHIVRITFFSFLCLSIGMYEGLYQNDDLGLASLSQGILLLSLILLLTYFLELKKNHALRMLRFWIFIAVAATLRIFMILSSPTPLIDVYSIQEIAPRAIIEGNNPYSLIYYFTWQKGALDVYSYGPFNILLNFPSVLIFHDPRYIQIISEISVAVLIYYVLRKYSQRLGGRHVAEMLPLIYLFNPRALYIIEQAWVDPILVFLVFLFACSLFIWKRKILSFIILGLAISTKQYAILIIPFLFRGGFIKLRSLFVTASVALVLSLPFLIWNFKDFFRDVVLFNLLIQESRFDSLSWNSFLYNNTGYEIPKLLVIAAEIALLFFLLKKQQKSLGSAVIFNTGVLLLFTYLVYRLAFIHYYYFAGSMIFLSMVLLLSEHFVKSARES